MNRIRINRIAKMPNITSRPGYMMPMFTRMLDAAAANLRMQITTSDHLEASLNCELLDPTEGYSLDDLNQIVAI